MDQQYSPNAITNFKLDSDRIINIAPNEPYPNNLINMNNSLHKQNTSRNDSPITSARESKGVNQA